MRRTVRKVTAVLLSVALIGSTTPAFASEAEPAEPAQGIASTAEGGTLDDEQQDALGQVVIQDDGSGETSIASPVDQTAPLEAAQEAEDEAVDAVEPADSLVVQSDELPAADDNEEAVATEELTVRAEAQGATSAGVNLNAAKAKYGLANATVIEAATAGAISEALSRAGNSASASAPVIVHVPAGSYSIGGFTIPSNVFFVAENGASFVYAGTANKNSMVDLYGVLYGGSYDGANSVYNVINFADVNFSTVGGKNGIVDSATVVRAKRNGILANDSACRNGQVVYCTVKNCVYNGISVERDSHLKLISHCTTSDNGKGNGGTKDIYSGINLSHSDIDTIEYCTINNNVDKAISTNSDPVSKATHPGCTIGTITGCYMSGNGSHGVFLKPKCYVNNFTNNTLENNTDGLMCNGKTAAGTTGTSWAKNVAGNTFRNNSKSNIDAHWSGATVEIGSDNQIIGSKSNSIIAYQGGALTISGSKVTISGAKAAGISISGKGSKCDISSTGIVIKDNGSQGIYCNYGSLALKGTGAMITGNKKNGIYITNKSNVTVSGANTTLKSNKANGIYIDGKSTLSITGKKLNIQGSGAYGIQAKKSTVKITGANAVIQQSKSSGIGLYAKAKLTMTGKSSKITKNKKFGILASDKSVAKLRNVKFVRNKSGAKHATGKAKIK